MGNESICPNCGANISYRSNNGDKIEVCNLCGWSNTEIISEKDDDDDDLVSYIN